MTLVSIIVPVYNREKSLSFTIDSILNQSYSNFELLLINDGSKDTSGEICDNYAKKDTRIKVIHKNNGGVSSARNCGFSAAKGKYIFCVDSDDYLHKDYLQTFLQAKQNYPDADNIWCTFNQTTTIDKHLDIDTPSNLYTEYDYSDIPKLTQSLLPLPPWNKIYTREIIEKYNLHMDENLSLGEDFIFNLDYLSKTKTKKIILINLPLYNYVTGDSQSLDNKYYPNLLDMAKTINEAYINFAKDNNIISKKQKAVYTFCFYKLENVLLNTFKKENNMTFFEKIKYSNKILKSEDFKLYYKLSQVNPHPIFKFSYKHSNYIPAYILNKLTRSI